MKEKIIVEKVREFQTLYRKRPIKDNMGGMLSPHLFNTWKYLTETKPKVVIESGVWKGLGTWIIEKALPNAKIFSIDINFSNLQYKSDRAIYLNKDISTYDWSEMLSEYDKEDVLVFLDDHQSFLDRITLIYELGIKNILYEDNYPPSQGDCLSPKKILSFEDYVIDEPHNKTYHKFSYVDYDLFDRYVEKYMEFPPIFKLQTTRWGDEWNDINYPTEEPWLDNAMAEEFPILFSEAGYYTWICFLKLREIKK